MNNIRIQVVWDNGESKRCFIVSLNSEDTLFMLCGRWKADTLEMLKLSIKQTFAHQLVYELLCIMRYLQYATYAIPILKQSKLLR